MTQLLLVEDDELVGDGLRLLLTQAAFNVEWVRNATSAARSLDRSEFDAIVLDLNLPDGSGMGILANLRARGVATPVVVVTARDGIGDRIEALNRGADDYIVKPINIDELVARLRAVYRRSQGRADEFLRCGPVVLDPIAHTVNYRGSEIGVSKREFSVLQILMECPGKVVTRQRLEETLYSEDDLIASNAIEVHVHNLRKKLEHRFIRTVRGVGYKIEGG